MVHVHMYLYLRIHAWYISATVCQSQHEVKTITVCQAFIMNSDERAVLSLLILFFLAHQSGARTRDKARAHQLFIDYCSHTYVYTQLETTR